MSAKELKNREKAEEALKISETCHRKLFEIAQDDILILHEEKGKNTKTNKASPEKNGGGGMSNAPCHYCR